MKIVEPSFEIVGDVDGEAMLGRIELAGRTCYRSQGRIDEGSCCKSCLNIFTDDEGYALPCGLCGGSGWERRPSSHAFVRMVLDRGHESVIEHESISVRLVCDRGVSHELVRHRLAAFSQESTRYVRYGGGDAEGAELSFIRPPFWSDGGGLEAPDKRWVIWQGLMRNAEASYLALLDMGAKPEEARNVLPNSLRTEIVMTCNLREWRHVFRLRASTKAHPQMRQLMFPLLDEMRTLVPVVFDVI